MLRLVCDRCNKVVFTDDRHKSISLIIKDGSNKEKDVDLCSDCTNIFDAFMSNKDDSDDPVEMSLAEDGFECPRCYSHYNFAVIGGNHRIQVLRVASNTVEEGYVDQPFVNFNCTVCNLLLKIPKVVLEEVNK